MTRSEKSWYISLMVWLRIPVARASSLCVIRRSPRRVDSIILIIACISFAKNFTDLKPACQDFGRKIQNMAN